MRRARRLMRVAPGRREWDFPAKLIGLVKVSCLRLQLEKAFRTESGKASPHNWAQHFTALLDAAGFPGGARRLAEFQAQLVHELLVTLRAWAS